MKLNQKTFRILFKTNIVSNNLDITLVKLISSLKIKIGLISLS